MWKKISWHHLFQRKTGAKNKLRSVSWFLRSAPNNLMMTYNFTTQKNTDKRKNLIKSRNTRLKDGAGPICRSTAHANTHGWGSCFYWIHVAAPARWEKVLGAGGSSTAAGVQNHFHLGPKHETSKQWLRVNLIPELFISSQPMIKRSEVKDNISEGCKNQQLAEVIHVCMLCHQWLLCCSREDFFSHPRVNAWNETKQDGVVGGWKQTMRMPEAFSKIHTARSYEVANFQHTHTHTQTWTLFSFCTNTHVHIWHDCVPLGVARLWVDHPSLSLSLRVSQQTPASYSVFLFIINNADSTLCSSAVKTAGDTVTTM